MAVGLQYNYSLSPLFGIGLGINYNCKKKALINKFTIYNLYVTRKTIADSGNIIKRLSLTDFNP